jgi:type I restriction enzyme R subunit
MNTRLAGEATHFLPFNRGSQPRAIQCGAGNPQHTSGHRTGYFWEEVLARESFLDILGHFMFVAKKDEKIEDARGGARRVVRESVVFPRYHQLDAVRKLVAAARSEGAGGNYLIQHSAGSGKTNSISWLSHRLASLHDAGDAKVFDCVVVITDRRVLDDQLQDAIYQIEHAQGVVKAIDQDSKQLAAALIDGTKIVVTTLQKFPFVLRALLRVAGAESQEKATDEEKRQAKDWQAAIAKRRYAVIVDEAHSSQTGDTARELKAILGSKAAESEGAGEGEKEGEPDWEDRLNQVMESRYPQGQDAGTLRPAGRWRQAGGLPHLQHAPGHRGEVHPRRARQLHHVCHVLPPLEGGRGRPDAAQEEGRAGAGQVHEPPPAQHRAEGRSDGRAFSAQRDAPAGRPGQGHGGHLFAPARRALQAGF